MSLKGTIRDSWDVCRRKVNEALGTVERLDADEIHYDKTTSGMSATNVQSAIDEVDAGLDGAIIGLGTVSGKVESIETTLAGLTGFYAVAVSLAMAVGDTQYVKQDVANGGTLTRTDMSSDVPSNGTVHRVYYRKVKFL